MSDLQKLLDAWKALDELPPNFEKRYSGVIWDLSEDLRIECKLHGVEPYTEDLTSCNKVA